MNGVDAGSKVGVQYRNRLVGNESSDWMPVSCEGLSPQQIGSALRESPPGGKIRLVGVPKTMPGFASGLDVETQFRIDGDVGDYAFMLGANSNWEVAGDAGLGLAHSLVSSSLLIRGSAGDYLAACAQGGFVAVHGRSGNATAFGLAGAEVVVRSKSGDYAGAGMVKGILVLANGSGLGLGSGMTGGSIYLRGEAASVSPRLKKIRMKDADAMRLSLLLARAEIRGDAREFKLYQVPAH